MALNIYKLDLVVVDIEESTSNQFIIQPQYEEPKQTPYVMSSDNCKIDVIPTLRIRLGLDNYMAFEKELIATA